MKLYAESSAVLSWVLVESRLSRVFPLLTQAELIVASELTLLECDRTLIRAVSMGNLNQGQLNTRREELEELAEGWDILELRKDIMDRARMPFPSEPIRSLDAIHLASALAARAALPDLEVLSLDNRIRTAARQLGFRVQPE